MGKRCSFRKVQEIVSDQDPSKAQGTREAQAKADAPVAGPGPDPDPNSGSAARATGAASQAAPSPETESRPGRDEGASAAAAADGGTQGTEGRPSRDQGRPQHRRGRRPHRRRPRRNDNDYDFGKDNAAREPGQLLGVLEVLPTGSGFIRREDGGYVAGKSDVYVGPRLIQRFGLRTGDQLSGIVGRRPRNSKSPPLRYLEQVNGGPPDEAARRPDFNRLAAVHPKEQLRLECGRTFAGEPDMTNRVIDLFCPFGKGQRALIVAPAKAGKTTVLQSVAEGVVANHPECELVILLVDERPEEVTEMEACGFGEVVASTFDLTPERHCQVAEMTLEKARRRVETGADVVVILDSITRLARAHNTLAGGSGRTLSGGLDANSLEKPKRFLGSARLIKPEQGGGSLTIIGTALVDTGSRMDQVIFEEFKGTGNSELVLSRELADRRIFPAIDLKTSATRKEELLLPAGALRVSRAMRRQLSDLPPSDAMEKLLRVMRQSETNEDLIRLVTDRL